MNRNLLFSLITLALFGSVSQLTCADKQQQKRDFFAGLPAQHIQQEAKKYQAALLRSKKRQKQLDEKLMKQVKDNAPIETIAQTIAAGANVNAADNDSLPVLHWAITIGTTRVAELLLTCKASVGTVDKWGCTPLHHAASHGQIVIADLLLENRANINAAVSHVSATPLYHVPIPYKQMSYFLLEHGAMPGDNQQILQIQQNLIQKHEQKPPEEVAYYKRWISDKIQVFVPTAIANMIKEYLVHNKNNLDLIVEFNQTRREK